MHNIGLRDLPSRALPALTLVIALLIAPSLGAEEATTAEPATKKVIELSGQSIEFFTPPDFYEISDFAPQVRDRVAATLSPQQQLLAIFLGSADIERIRQGDPPRFERYFKISARRDPGAHMIDEPGFAAIRDRFAGNTGLIGKDGFVAIPADEMQRFAQPGAIAYGETLLVRVISRSDWHVTLGTLSNQDTSGNPAKLIAGTTSIVRLGDRLVDLDGYALMTDSQTARWIGEETVRWIEALVIAARDN